MYSKHLQVVLVSFIAKKFVLHIHFLAEVRKKLLTCWLINTGFLISGYIPTILGASSAIEIYSSKVIMVNCPEE